jgi:hypothetical protein
MVRAGGEFLSTPLPQKPKNAVRGVRKGHTLLDGLALAIFCPATYCAAARVLALLVRWGFRDRHRFQNAVAWAAWHTGRDAT